MWVHLLLLVGVVAAQQSFQPRYHQAQASQRRVYYFNPGRPAVPQRRATTVYYTFPSSPRRSSRRSYQQLPPQYNSKPTGPSTDSASSVQPQFPQQDSSYQSRIEESLANIQKSLNLIVRYQESQYLAQLEKDAATAANQPEGDSMNMMTSLDDIQKSLNLIVRYLESQYISSLENQAAAEGTAGVADTSQ